MAKSRKPKKEASIIPQTKLLRVFQIIAVLKTGKWTIANLAERFDTSERTIYRYIKLLEAVELLIEQDFEKRFFIHTSEDDPGNAEFTMEELKLIKKLIQSEMDNNPLKGLLLKKLSLNSESDKVPRIIVKAKQAKLVEQFSSAIRHRKQVILKSYHSANSNEVSDRLVEPIEFGDNYQTIVALDTKDKKCKQFKLDRIGEAIEQEQSFQFPESHVRSAADIFGMTGTQTYDVVLQLKMRAYLLLREEYPLSIPYCEARGDKYEFRGQVNSLDGIGRFVLGLIDEIKVEAPNELIEYVTSKIKARIA